MSGTDLPCKGAPSILDRLRGPFNRFAAAEPSQGGFGDSALCPTTKSTSPEVYWALVQTLCWLLRKCQSGGLIVKDI